MSAKILVVDDIPANVRVLEARLEASYYRVVTAASGPEALAVAAAERPDLILLDVMMPGMDGFECCRRLKQDPALASIPVVMVTALDQPADRVAGLEAGADDFLTKPPHDLALFARVRSLLRIKMMIDELNMRDATSRDFGVIDPPQPPLDQAAGAKLVLVDPRPARVEAMASALRDRLGVVVDAATDRRTALTLAQSDADAFLIASHIGEESGLRLCSQLRSQPNTRQSSLMLIVDHDDFDTAAEGLDLGVDDYLMRPIEESELAARVRAQLRRKRYADRLRETLRSNVQMAMTDGLTGLYNRRYADQYLDRQVADRNRGGGDFALVMLDIDFFKSVNDTYGHGAGDEVLVEFARRLSLESRSADLVSRYGGEEFILAMPDASLEEGVTAAERVRLAVAQHPFATSAGLITVTSSAGVAGLCAEEGALDLLRRADAALYDAKRAGRDRVAAASPTLGARAAVLAG